MDVTDRTFVVVLAMAVTLARNWAVVIFPWTSAEAALAVAWLIASAAAVASPRVLVPAVDGAGGMPSRLGRLRVLGETLTLAVAV